MTTLLNILMLLNPITLFITYVIYTRLDKKTWTFYLFIVPAVLLDAFVNVTWFSLIFFECPREWLLTKRIERLKEKSGYRGWLAKIGCRILNYFEKDHCL